MILVLVGVIGWILLQLAGTKDKYDSGGKKFSFKKYIDVSWDDWLFALAGGYIVYFAFPLIWQLWFHYKEQTAPELVDSGFYAALCGFFGGLVLQLIYRLIKKFTNGKD